MSRIPELRAYKHRDLMDDYNNLQIRIKVHLFNLGDDQFKLRHPKPTGPEIDQMMHRIMAVLMEDSKPIRFY